MTALLVLTLLAASPQSAPALPGPGGGREQVVAPRLADRAILAMVADRKRSVADRMFLLEELAMRDQPLSLSEVLAIRSSVRREWQADYVRCLARCGPEAVEELSKYLKKRDPFVRAEAVFGIVQQDRDGGEEFARSVLRDAKMPAEAKVAALRGLSMRDSMFARVEAIRRLSTADGSLLLEALAVLRRKPDLANVRYLIDLLAADKGRASNEAVLLLQEMTGYRIGRDPQLWKYWMLKHKMDGTPFRREVDPLEDEGATLAYMGIPILGNKVVFVLDSSGSMETPLPERMRQTRGSRAVEELVSLLPRLPLAARFDVVFFESSIRSYADELVPRTGDELERITRWLRANRFEGGTNLFGGLEEAFLREDVEEIFLLSDGEPTAGALVDPARIVARVARWNRWRMVRVNTISLGAPPPARNFLYRLAADNEGVCRVLQ